MRHDQYISIHINTYQYIEWDSNPDTFVHIAMLKIRCMEWLIAEKKHMHINVNITIKVHISIYPYKSIYIYPYMYKYMYPLVYIYI